MADGPVFPSVRPRKLTFAVPENSRDGKVGPNAPPPAGTGNIVVPGAGVELRADGGSPVDAGSVDGNGTVEKRTFDDGPVEKDVSFYRDPQDPSKSFSPFYKSVEALPVCEVNGIDAYFNENIYEDLARIWETHQKDSSTESPHVILFRPPEKTKRDLLDFLQSGIRELPLRDRPTGPLEEILAIGNLSDGMLLPMQGRYGNFTLQTEENIPLMGKQKISLRYPLCRSASRDPDDNFFRVWSYKNNSLFHPLPSNQKMAPIEGELTLYQIMEIIVEGKLTPSQYGVEEGKLFISGNLPTVDAMIQRIGRSSLSDQEKKNLIAAVNEAVKMERAALAIIEGQGALNDQKVNEDRIFKLFFVIYLLYSLKLQRATNARLTALDKKIDPKSFLKDVTEKAKKSDYSRLVGNGDVQENMLDIAAQKDQPHVFVAGEGDVAGTGDSAGSGKSENVKAHLHTRALEGYEVFEMSGSGLGSAAAKYVGKAEEAVNAMFEYINEATRSGKRVVIWVREAHVLKGIGTAEGHPTDVVQLMLDKLERFNDGSYFVFDTNKPHGVDGRGGLLDDEAFLRRVSVALVSPPNIEDAVQIIKTNIARYVGKTMKINDPEIHTLVLLSPLTNGGALPASGFKLLDRITSHLRRRNFTGAITEEMIIERVAAVAKIDAAMVRSFLEFARIAIEKGGLTPEIVKGMLVMLKKKGYYTKDGLILTAERVRAMVDESRAHNPSLTVKDKGSKGPPKTPPITPPSAGAPPTDGAPPPPTGGSTPSTSSGASGEGGQELKPTQPKPEEVQKITIAGRKPPTLLEMVTDSLKLPLVFGGLRYATRRHWIPGWMEPTIAVGVGAVAVWVDHYALLDLGLMVPPFELSRNITTVVMDGVGLPAGSAENETAGILGGFAGTAAIVHATGGPQVWREAGKAVVKRMVENGVMGGLRETAVIGAKTFAEDARAVLSVGAKTAAPRIAGGALAVVTMSSCGDTPHRTDEWQYDNKEIKAWIAWAKKQFDIPWENISLNNLNEKLADGRTGMEHNLARVADKRAKAFLISFLPFAYEQITHVFDTDEVRARRTGLEAFKNRQVSAPQPAPKQPEDAPILVAFKK